MTLITMSDVTLESIRETLAAQLPWSIYDYIRELSANADRAMFAEYLTRPLAEENDLRSLIIQPDGTTLAVFVERLPWDSTFFGYGVARLNGIFPIDAPIYRPMYDYGAAVQQITEEARRRGIRYLFATVDPRDLALMRAVCQAGYALIESRCFYHIDLRAYSYPHRFACRLATDEDVESLATTAVEMVNPYDRFHSDPWVDPCDADRLMRRWVEASILNGFADATFVPDVPSPRAFCTVRYHEDKWDRWQLRMSQPVFSAVSAEARGSYLKLISEITYHLRDRGSEHAFLSTQVTSKAVIRVWEKLGYVFGKSEHVFRIVL